jgi:cysteine synthase
MRFIETGVASARQIADHPGLTVHEKLLSIIMAQKPDGDGRKGQMIEQFHQPDNAKIHQKSLALTILHLTLS